MKKRICYFIHKFIYYFSYFIALILLLLLIGGYKNKGIFLEGSTLAYFLFAVVVLAAFVYSRFIEKNIIITKITKIKTGFQAKFIVISDLHLGIYKGSSFLEKVVKKINQIDKADAVFIVGDFVYCHKNNLKSLFYPLEKIKLPVYAVFGNHDYRNYAKEKLKKVLKEYKINILENESAKLRNKNITILGLGDIWKKQADFSKINNFSKKDNLIVLAHNPDSVLYYKNSIPALTISGHTHGGQIRLPYLYKKIIPCKSNFYKGFYQFHLSEEAFGKLFVSIGLGEVTLPMRFFSPPTIDILELY